MSYQKLQVIIYWEVHCIDTWGRKEGKTFLLYCFLIFCKSSGVIILPFLLSLRLLISLPIGMLFVILSLHAFHSLVLLLICMSLLPDLKWPASIPTNTVPSWWRSFLSSVIELCGADGHGKGVNTHTPFKLLRFSCSSHQSYPAHTGLHFISLTTSQKAFRVQV